MSESTGHYKNIFKVVSQPDKYLYVFRYCTGWQFLISTDPVSPHKYEKKLTQVEYFKRLLQPRYETEVLLTIPKLLPENKLDQLITNLEIELHILGYPIFHHTSGLRLRYDIPSLTSSSPSIPSTSKIKVSTPIVEQLVPHLLELPIKQEDQLLIDAAIRETEKQLAKANKNREAVKKSTKPKPLEVLEQLNELNKETETNHSKIDELLEQHNKSLSPTQQS